MRAASPPFAPLSGSKRAVLAVGGRLRHLRLHGAAGGPWRLSAAAALAQEGTPCAAFVRRGHDECLLRFTAPVLIALEGDAAPLRARPRTRAPVY